MTRIIHHIEYHAEAWGAVALGIFMVASCVAMAAAFNGVL
jgi:hypothetical protein